MNYEAVRDNLEGGTPVVRRNCTKCHKEKGIADFHRDTKGPDGYSWQCRECRCANEARRTNTAAGNLRQRWNAMLARCNKESDPHFRWYGARGIAVCQEWNSFAQFMDWAMANGFEIGLELDRRDVNGGYSPSNCRWVTHSENMRNLRAYGKSGFVGVYRMGHRWQASVFIDGKNKHLGMFATAEEAARARDAVAVPLGFRANLQTIGRIGE